MLDLSHLPTPGGTVDTFFGTLGSSFDTTNGWVVWQKPRGKSMCHIMLVGNGGNGGDGAVGANSAAAGGGGGSSGGQVSATIPLWALPDTLFLKLPANSIPSSPAIVSVVPQTGTLVTANVLLYASRGQAGGNAAAGTAGAAGAAAVAGGASVMPLGWQWVDSVYAGQAGIIGGVAVAGGALTLPATGLLVTGGTGGGGLPAAAAVGSSGGAITASGIFPAHTGGAGAASATVPGGNGSGGYKPITGLLRNYGGVGGGSTHGSATGAGLVAGGGGNGAPGCGGGGGGGGLTGSTQGLGGVGGPAFCVITCW